MGLFTTCPQSKPESLTPLKWHSKEKLKYWYAVLFIFNWTSAGFAAVQKTWIAVGFGASVLTGLYPV